MRPDHFSLRSLSFPSGSTSSPNPQVLVLSPHQVFLRAQSWAPAVIISHYFPSTSGHAGVPDLSRLRTIVPPCWRPSPASSLKVSARLWLLVFSRSQHDRGCGCPTLPADAGDRGSWTDGDGEHLNYLSEQLPVMFHASSMAMLVYRRRQENRLCQVGGTSLGNVHRVHPLGTYCIWTHPPPPQPPTSASLYAFKVPIPIPSCESTT